MASVLNGGVVAGRHTAPSPLAGWRAIPQRVQQVAVERTELSVGSRLPALLANTGHLRLRLQSLGHAAPIALSALVSVVASIATIATLSLLLPKGSWRSSRPSVRGLISHSFRGCPRLHLGDSG